MPGTLPLDAFLSAGRLHVIDVAAGAARGTRRVLLGVRGSSAASHVVSVAATPVGVTGLDAEVRHLDALRPRARPSLRDTLPEVVDRVDVHGAPGVVLTAVPGLDARPSPVAPAATGPRDPVLGWLMMLWADTSEAEGQVDVGRAAYDSLHDRLTGARGAAPALEAVRRSLAALDGVRTPRTASHGCLCPRHLRIADGRTVGVDDWGTSHLRAEPLRDLGAWVVRTAGDGIGELLTGRTEARHDLRDLVTAGLTYWGLPPGLWRDVVVLALAEAAADGLDARKATAVGLLTAVGHQLVRAPDTTEGTRT